MKSKSCDRNPTRFADGTQQPGKRTASFYGVLSMIGTGITILGVAGCSNPSTVSSEQQTTAQVIEDDNDIRDRALEPTPKDTNFVVRVVNKVEPAVVRIHTEKTVETQIPNAFNDPFFRRFFGSSVPQPQERIVRGIGSGFVISDDGEIITNAHVVNKADTVTVSFPDGRTFEGEVLGEDPVTDIAVVKVSADDLPTVELGNSQGLQTGQWAIAIGNPLGLQETVTVGVISGIDRSSSEVGVPDKRIGFIQTDAAINPGNSGGPLLNARGEVIGVNTAIIQGAQGIGFAIPIDIAKEISQQLITKGKVEHPYLGIQMVALTPEIKQKINTNPNNTMQVQPEEGILIVRVIPNSPADEAGLKAGDVIQKINNQSVTEAETVQKLVEANGVDNPLPLEVQRNSETLEFTVIPEPLPPEDE
ncbi:MAG: HhoA/HhoB/HtrA family serine endopeptidase [Coleofasciculus sp. G1-WW12-02]|uniref:HhoA/HhoB/HtrA family serine endopeptidase n=1 Tax=Coleofasciculus sp. G1-WW12-02 TaxID=3068483 RepID=UPI0032F5FF0B